MIMNPQAYNQFKKQNLAALSDLQAVVLLYTEAIDSLKKAKEHYASKNDEYKKNIARTQKIIQGLRSILDFKKGGEVALNLAELYTYFNSRLTVASYGVRQTSGILSEVSGLLEKLKESWVSISAQEKNTGQPRTSIEKLDINI